MIIFDPMYVEISELSKIPDYFPTINCSPEDYQGDDLVKQCYLKQKENIEQITQYYNELLEKVASNKKDSFNNMVEEKSTLYAVAKIVEHLRSSNNMDNECFKKIYNTALRHQQTQLETLDLLDPFTL